MAQVRNLLRGVAFTTDGSPARVLNGLDEALLGLGVDAFATAVLARVEQTEEDTRAGLRTLRWSNAGHPPPVLLAPDGSVRLLTTPPDLVLGMAEVGRGEHTATLEPGAVVVLYTDGLVERRGTAMDDSLRWLADALEGRQDLSAEELCEHIVGRLGDDVDDDIALLVLKAHAEDRPRPAVAGPEVLPADLRAG
jgi:serine phosphatase RsbU (regulator of sigma subunit)